MDYIVLSHYLFCCSWNWKWPLCWWMFKLLLSLKCKFPYFDAQKWNSNPDLVQDFPNYTGAYFEHHIKVHININFNIPICLKFAGKRNNEKNQLHTVTVKYHAVWNIINIFYPVRPKIELWNQKNPKCVCPVCLVCMSAVHGYHFEAEWAGTKEIIFQ